MLNWARPVGGISYHFHSSLLVYWSRFENPQHSHRIEEDSSRRTYTAVPVGKRFSAWHGTIVLRVSLLDTSAGRRAKLPHEFFSQSAGHCGLVGRFGPIVPCRMPRGAQVRPWLCRAALAQRTPHAARGGPLASIRASDERVCL